MRKLLIGTAMIAAVSMTACANTSMTPTSYSDYVSAAQEKHEIAKANNNVWKQKKMKKPYVEHYLAKAEEAKKKGDDTAALKYAKEAYKSANAQVNQINSWKELKAGWVK